MDAVDCPRHVRIMRKVDELRTEGGEPLVSSRSSFRDLRKSSHAVYFDVCYVTVSTRGNWFLYIEIDRKIAAHPRPNLGRE